MDQEEYDKLYKGLRGPKDIEAFEKEGYDHRMLETIYTQKINRSVRRKHPFVKRNTKNMLREWKSGHTFCQIAKSYKYPPVLTAMMIFQENGTSRKAFWEYVRDPSLLDSEETAKELQEAAQKDLVFSPEGVAKANERGKWGEGLLWEWLDGQNVDYKTEYDERSEDGSQGSKTPDCLLAEPMDFNGTKIYWIESKASFGDSVEFKYNCTKQLIPYTQLFGPGVVVYWNGHVDGLECPSDLLVEDIGILEKDLKPFNNVN